MEVAEVTLGRLPRVVVYLLVCVLDDMSVWPANQIRSQWTIGEVDGGRRRTCEGVCGDGFPEETFWLRHRSFRPLTGGRDVEFGTRSCADCSVKNCSTCAEISTQNIDNSLPRSWLNLDCA